VIGVSPDRATYGRIAKIHVNIAPIAPTNINNRPNMVTI
jgi:hypothetical protein